MFVTWVYLHVVSMRYVSAAHSLVMQRLNLKLIKGDLCSLLSFIHREWVRNSDAGCSCTGDKFITFSQTTLAHNTPTPSHLWFIITKYLKHYFGFGWSRNEGKTYLRCTVLRCLICLIWCSMGLYTTSLARLFKFYVSY